MTGAFAHIDASAPRRPQDKARLVSSEFQATDPDNPLCLRYVILALNFMYQGILSFRSQTLTCRISLNFKLFT